MTSHTRQRAAYVALALGTMAVGLSVHLGGGALTPTARDVLGDALWAAMLAWWIGALVPARPILLRAGLALAGSFAVEASQLFHAPVLDAVRSSRLGHLVLGSGFHARDLLAYTGGVLAAGALESSWRRCRFGLTAGASPV